MNTGNGDARVEYIRNRMLSTFPKLAGPKFDKSFIADDTQKKILEFLNCDDLQRPLLYCPDTLRLEIAMPKKLPKGKSLVFIKANNGTPVFHEKIGEEIMTVELGSGSQFEQVELLAHEIFLPILSNGPNQEKWGEVSTREIMDKFYSFLSSSTILCGQIRGETRLPMPPFDVGGSGGLQGKNRISLLEGAIITWTKQIKGILKQDSEGPLKMGLHPTPDVEILFWKNRADHLNSIFDQLQGPSIRRVLKALDQSNSTYCTSFARLCKEVYTARLEANDNTKYLKTLRDWFDRLDGESDFSKLQDLFKPIMHILLLIWKNSKYYNTPTKLVVMVREICNSLIAQAYKFCSGEQVFALIDQDESSRAIEQIRIIVHVCKSFKQTYTEYRDIANSECPNKPWSVQDKVLFTRLDSFLERCHDILGLIQTIIQFSKLAKIEIGGTKGSELTFSIKQIHSDFEAASGRLKSVSYDIIDVSVKQFDDDFYAFHCSMKELERRLGAVISMGFDDCSTTFRRFKLLDSFEGLLERPIIQDELEKKYISLVQKFGADLRLVQETFLKYRDSPPIPWNLPAISGSLAWCRGLVERISIPMEKLKQLDKRIVDRDEAKEVTKIYSIIMANLLDYENQQIKNWSRDIEKTSQLKLDLPLLLRDSETQSLSVNFDPALVKLLREVKYFLLLGLHVPHPVLKIYEQVETFRKWRGSLDLVVNLNNEVLTELLPVEKPLVKPYLEKFDRAVLGGVDKLSWCSKEGIIDEFIGLCSEQINSVHEVSRSMKSNLMNIRRVLELWNEPLMERKPKPVDREELERSFKSFRTTKYTLIKEGGKDIHNMLKETNKILKCSNASSDWKMYVDFINNVIVEGLSKSVCCSLAFLLDQIKSENGVLPMLEIKMELINENIFFSPDFGSASGHSTRKGKSIRELVYSWIGYFFNISSLFKRLENDGSYLREIQSDVEVQIYLAQIDDALDENEKSAESLRASYDKYSYLWQTPMEQYFVKFCEEAMLTTELGQLIPDLSMYDAELKRCEDVQAAVKKLSSPQDIGWVRVNVNPMKQALLTWSAKWSHHITSILQRILVGKLNELEQFLVCSSKGLQLEVASGKEGNKDLMSVMRDISDIRKRTGPTREIFEPLRQITVLLKKHSVDLNNVFVCNETKSVLEYLEEAPASWDALVKAATRKKEDILPLQIAEVDSIKEELEKFYTSIREFRGKFRVEAPFAFSGPVREAYERMDIHAVKLMEKEAQVRRYNKLEDLFELQISKYPETRETREELRLLKIMWDLKANVGSTYMQWQTTLWSQVNTEALDDENKLMLKQIRKYGSDSGIIKGWQVYRDIEDMIKDMSVILPLVNDLHSKAMRNRHWLSLASICHVKCVDPTDPKFTLDDMMKLQLNKHVEDVSEVVETAQKELKIENKLVVIEGAWGGLLLDFVPHKDTEILLMKPSEELVETLEAHQMELQSIVGMGKFVDFFRDRVTHWQKTLGNLEEVLKLWTNVSRSWASLESIFLASADIRSQLPDDTKRFEGIDSEFKELMKEAVNTPNSIEACTPESRFENLKSMMSRLEMCQKSLNEYLDMKKKIFPRFYFVSNVALLDMLANGTNPPKIMPYLGDCYDSISNLTFVKGSNGEPDSIKTVDKMVAKDKEVIPLAHSFTMEGEVEGYLNRLTDMMMLTLKKSLSEGIETAVNWEVEKPRHQWLFDYPAQVVLTGTQIYWTEETEGALEEYEGGQEDAVKRYLGTCNTRLNHLISLVLGNLTPADRTKIISLITLDVHARDVVQKLINDKTEGPSSFLWQQQLRFYWSQSTLDVDIRITDFRCKYFYEWIGNTGRLVITPLTDRCYITLTMGLRLFLGGAPAGPAGTGKTETTKDLARALALPCYVFNCSDQMNYQTMADIFRGLAQTGAWGCFDEFNRIPIEVLSVVATQVKTIQDAIVKYSVPTNRDTEYQHLPPGTPPCKVGYLDFCGDVISLIPTCGFFITMNPGYAGRTELPENLKALFRSCAMIRPDLRPICENMLMSEGFQKARTLAIKFVTLYQLSSELLSKQFHYDWGLRAVKSVLRVAGMLKRGEPNLDEAQILMRALRDFNTPKIPAHDTGIFLRLIADLFMGLEVPTKVNETLKAKCSRAALELGYQRDDTFLNKAVQFQELLDVRHSVMLLGPAGCAKTTIWKTLAGAHNLDKVKKTCVYETVNPKAVSGDELYGYMTLSKDWKDGVLSIIMRGMSKNFIDQGFNENQTYKWVVLDGDIDAVWIESMNTVMDDNKVLTLVSNERVPLSDAMRMVFEINSLKNATPATVSRAGILFINESDVGWKPFVESWAAKRTDPTEHSLLPGLFLKYIDSTASLVRKGYKEVTPIRLLNKVCTVVYLLEGLLEKVPPEVKVTAEFLEKMFIFALCWAFGGPMVVDKASDYRKKFSEEFCSTFPFAGTHIPKEGSCFDYFFDPLTNSFTSWNAKIDPYKAIAIGSGSGETSFSQLHVSTIDTVRLSTLMDVLVRKNRFMMLVGTAGTGKTSIIRKYLGGLDKETDGLLSVNVNMSYYSDSAIVQRELELYIDKRSGRRFGPPATKRMVYFVDDINLPYVETYGTQNAIALLTQLISYGTIFDRSDLGFRKEIVDVQFVSAMNPTAGSFEICERLQRHFATFCVSMPSSSDLKGIYGSIFTGHMSRFVPAVSAMSDKIVDASIALHKMVSEMFLPSAIKFTYNWNMRELSSIFSGMVLASPHSCTTPTIIGRLWLHECERVFKDRLISEEDLTAFDAMTQDVSKKFLGEVQNQIFERPLIFTGFGGNAVGDSGGYNSVTSISILKQVLDGKLKEYNESNAMMDLVLFEQAMEHVTRICRIISRPSGNAMLIGVGGSGKQSLSKLAAYICGFEVRQLAITMTFKVEDLREALKEMFKAAGVKGMPIMLLMTDGQIVNDRFLISINSILSNGWISDLFAKDEQEGLFGSLRNEAKACGIADNPQSMMDFLILRIKANLHVVLCFSPVGDLFRVRARRFPGLVNCTTIDFFHPWTREALISVASRFLEDVDLGTEAVKSSLAIHMAEEHLSVTHCSREYFELQRRYNYVTPKSYLELIGFYKFLLDQKRSDVQRQIDRLDVGLSTLRKTATDVAELQIDLTHTITKVEEKKFATEELLIEMGTQREGAEKQRAAATIEAEKASIASAEASKIEVEAEKELSAAEPAMKAASAAVDCLSKSMLTELKSLAKPPAGVDKVTKAVLILVEKEQKNHSWDRAKKMMANVDTFKNNLATFRGESITEAEITKIEPILNDPEFTVENMKAKSAAAANLCTWVVSIYTYNRIYVKVKPLMDRLEAARQSKAAADESLQLSNEAVANVEAKMKFLEQKFQEATDDKARVEAEAANCINRLGLAERLVGGLSSENERWGKEIEKLKNNALTLVGDCMLAAGFVSYVGAFDSDIRNKLWKDTWIPDLDQKQIPITPGVDPLDLLTTDGKNAKMISEGLPSDRISIENGAVITSCKRWPLIIDPQAQGIKWLRRREEGGCSGLQVIQFSQKNWLRTLESAITNGTSLIIENIGEDLDATLEPVLARAIYKKGRALYMKLAGEEVEYDPGFQLYLQTKLSNPHYKPEIAAQCTLINFIATEKGLEDQLLARVVGAERPELENQAQELQAAFQQYKIQLVQLEDDLLERLANAPEDILSDVPLIEGLEATKATAKEIAEAVETGKETEKEINVARELYRRQATEGAMLYFLLTKLCTIDHMYQYSLDSYIKFFMKSIKKAASADHVDQRVLNLREALRMTVYSWVSRGLFERHKLIFLSQLTFNLMKRGILGEENIINEAFLRYLMRGTKKLGEPNPLTWLPDSAWESCLALSDVEDFSTFSTDLVEAAPRFREWFNHITPETEKLPLDWSSLEKAPFQKMLVVRALRPDRMTASLGNFIRGVLPHGHAYTDCDSTLNSFQILEECYGDSTCTTPIYFVLSPGANVVGDLDRLAVKYGFVKNERYHNVSMGQGQDVVAMSCLETAHRDGHWVILNNIHLMPRWLIDLEKKMDEFAVEGSHEQFRIFLSSDPSNAIPIGILSRCIKLTNEPPAGLKANLKRAFANFSRDYIEDADSKTKSILFGLCHFHAIMMERKLYGPMGFNMMYPFSVGDLRDSAVCLANYMENSGGGKIPWQDLKYIFGEIMYGGHIVNDFDRLLANTYLDWYMKDELLDETEMYPFAEEERGITFPSPAPSNYDKYLEHIDTVMGPDTPIAFGLHPNAEIEFRTQQSDSMFRTLMELQPRDAAGGQDSLSPEQIVSTLAESVLERFGEKKYDVKDIAMGLEEAGPYQNVFMQEMEVMNTLLSEMIRSLKELQQGFAGELTMSDSMEHLMDALYLDKVPSAWVKRAWPSLRPLASWLTDLTLRLNQLDEWQTNPSDIPRVTWLSGLVNPQSFLTAVCQVTAQKNAWELDKLVTQTDMLKKLNADDIDAHSRDGAYICGASMQGARWDIATGSIEKSRPKEMFSAMPVMNVRGVSVDRADTQGVYMCPAYKTAQRGPTYVFSAQLKTKSTPARWVLAGVALLFDVA